MGKSSAQVRDRRGESEEEVVETFERDSVQDILTYYQGNQEVERHSRQQMEFRVTQKILLQEIPPQSRVLELGAGTGFYTSVLARAGHSVVAVDLTDSLLAINKNHIEQEQLTEKVQFHVSDARDIDRLKLGQFDVVLAMGPYYHMVKYQERMALTRLLAKHVQVGGKLMTAHLTRLGFLSYMLYKYPFWIETHRKQVNQLHKKGFFTDHPRDGSFRGYFSTLEELYELHQAAELHDTQCFSQDPLIGGCDELFNRLPEVVKEKWVEQAFQACTDPLAWGSGRSVMCVSQKRAK